MERLGLTATRERAVTRASGQQVTYRTGPVNVRLDGEAWTTFFLPGALALVGAVTPEQFGVGPDPVRQTLVPVAGFLP